MNCYSPNFQGFILMKNVLNNQVGMLGDLFLWLVANLKQGFIYFIKQALPPNISAGSVGAIFSLYLSSLQKSSPIAVAGHKKVILSTLYYGILCCIHTYGASKTIVGFEIACFFIKILKKCNTGYLTLK